MNFLNEECNNFDSKIVNIEFIGPESTDSPKDSFFKDNKMNEDNDEFMSPKNIESIFNSKNDQISTKNYV